MNVYRFPTLIWGDTAGCFTALPIDCDDDRAVGYGSGARAALKQLSDYLNWAYQRDPQLSAPDFHDARLLNFRVPVRPEYTYAKKLHACDEVHLTVPCVAGRQSSGMFVAALPLLNLRFTYYLENDLKDLAWRYVQQYLRGQTPTQLVAALPPLTAELDEVVVRVKPKNAGLDQAPKLPTLQQVAEPLGDASLRKQFAPPWERTEVVATVVEKLHRERANVLLVGESGSGKTSVIVEAARQVERLHQQDLERRGESLVYARLFWQTSAGRLIAGMKYLGQWEQRCERVVDELTRIPGILCLDRLLDLVRTGGGSGTLATFFLPYLQRGELRIVGEATPAELDACRRLMPGLVDLCAVLTLPPFTRPQALSILDQTFARYAQGPKLTIAPGASDRVYDLFRRFAPYQAFPGAAVAFVRDLCERQHRLKADPLVTPGVVIGHFVRRTGLPEWLLRDEVPLDAGRLRADLAAQVIGQPAALDVAARVVIALKAGLNDPNRPVGVLLFCGPTGVGKTELAKALTRVLFGHGADATTAIEKRLLRLDMSEYGGYDAVERLLGPPGGDPGPLVRQIRQQPFSVILLDEIEKAAGEVFDVLMGVCDEGRLTDRFGRVTTFRGAVLVMTSNLGGERRGSYGFGPGAGGSTYTDAARAFFRPEFFNRLDAVVPFDPLTADIIRQITRKELVALATREGVTRVGVRVRWTDALVAWLAETGFDPLFGARPLQRAIERQVATPLARFLLEQPVAPGLNVCVDYEPLSGVRVAAE
jgi:ATP-dependent Clp protease ATP-binding subunit ClpC